MASADTPHQDQPVSAYAHSGPGPDTTKISSETGSGAPPTFRTVDLIRFGLGWRMIGGGTA